MGKNNELERPYKNTFLAAFEITDGIFDRISTDTLTPRQLQDLEQLKRNVLGNYMINFFKIKTMANAEDDALKHDFRVSLLKLEGLEEDYEEFNKAENISKFKKFVSSCHSMPLYMVDYVPVLEENKTTYKPFAQSHMRKEPEECKEAIKNQLYANMLLSTIKYSDDNTRDILDAEGYKEELVKLFLHLTSSMRESLVSVIRQKDEKYLPFSQQLSEMIDSPISQTPIDIDENVVLNAVIEAYGVQESSSIKTVEEKDGQYAFEL